MPFAPIGRLRRCQAFALLVILVAAAPASAALTADNLVLIVNRNQPAGRELAEHYAEARHVPAGRIVELDLPTGDWLPRDQWDAGVVAPLRAFLATGDLKQTVRCAVTFYGVPLAVEGIALNDADQAERREIDADAAAVRDKLAPLVRRAEQLIDDVGDPPSPGWPTATTGLEEVLARLEAAQQNVQARAAKLTPAQRQTLAAKIVPLKRELDAPMDAGGPTAAGAEATELLARNDAASRRRLRAMLRVGAPMAQYATLLVRQQRQLDDAESDASFDSELSTLWMDAVPRSRWLANPLARPGSRGDGGVLMVARLDGRDPPQVRRLIDDAVSVETAGLHGKIVIDSRGIAANTPQGTVDAYGRFDEQLRDLNKLLAGNTPLPIVFDYAPDVIGPLPGVDGVAVYVGWYSVQKYVPGLRLVRGAVGYHVASYEMKSLRTPGQLGWVRGLLDDGIAGTLGPVSEPYLAAFPPPERFVPLLLAGKLTLAEVYWRTVPMLSWKLGLVGDPLYRPFAANPAFPVDKLPPDVAGLIE